MASLFRKTRTRYVDADGVRTTKDGDGARPKRVRSKDWYGRYRDADGIQREKRLASNKTAAQQMLNELVRRSELGRAGVVDPFADHSQRTLSEHVADFRRYLEAKGNTASHVDGTDSRLRAINDGCGFKRLADLSASRVVEWLAEQRKAERFGVSTSNHYLTAIKAFSRWLVKDRRIAEDRLAHLTRLKADADRRIERRHLTPAEFGRFIEGTRIAGDRYGLSGESRAMLYLTAAYTGLRASELASLTPASFDLAADPPTVTVEAGYSKHRQRDELPLHPELAAQLRQWLAVKRSTMDEAQDVIRINTASDATDGPLWPGRWAADRRGWRMVKADLATTNEAAAKACPPKVDPLVIPYRDEQGRQFDFHALRHQFISMLAAAGVHPKTAQELARHSTITLTMDHYTHLRVSDLTSALNALPTLTPAREAVGATGTEDAQADPAVSGAYVSGITGTNQQSTLGARMGARPADISCDSVTS
ncbi:MAG: site-specific integrase, partial [Planctomycetaceae bacterium]|nr:site-specific integrase [Planctomycetaceae bacterium]